MRTVSLEEAQLHLGELLDAAPEGELFLIARDGKPVAELMKKTCEKAQAAEVSLIDSQTSGKRRLGFLKGKFIVPDDIKTPFKKEIEEMFYGKE